jgi:hypothetical protein
LVKIFFGLNPTTTVFISLYTLIGQQKVFIDSVSSTVWTTKKFVYKSAVKNVRNFTYKWLFLPIDKKKPKFSGPLAFLNRANFFFFCALLIVVIRTNIK